MSQLKSLFAYDAKTEQDEVATKREIKQRKCNEAASSQDEIVKSLRGSL